MLLNLGLENLFYEIGKRSIFRISKRNEFRLHRTFDLKRDSRVFHLWRRYYNVGRWLIKEAKGLDI